MLFCGYRLQSPLLEPLLCYWNWISFILVYSNKCNRDGAAAHILFLRWTNRLWKAFWAVVCFPPVRRDKKAGVERKIGLSLLHIPLVTFVTRDGVWGLQIWPPEPLSLTLFSGAPILLCVCVCVWVFALTPCFWAVLLSDIVQGRGGPDLSCRRQCLTWFLKSIFRAVHCRFVHGLRSFLRQNQNVWAPSFLSRK